MRKSYTISEFKKSRHPIYKPTYYLVVVAEYRKKCISEEMHIRLKEIAKSILECFNCGLIEMNGEEDHIHLLFEAPPQVQLSKLINNFKTVSSRYICKEYAEEVAKYYWKPYFWSNSYMVFSTGGAPLEVIKNIAKIKALNRASRFLFNFKASFIHICLLILCTYKTTPKVFLSYLVKKTLKQTLV
ncbi:IS200/IS605 family transposase [Priestia aryabhattai]